MKDTKQDSTKLIREALRSVPLPPRAVRELLQISQETDVDMQRIVDTVTSDEALTARVIRVVNSALFGLQRRVTSVQQALVLLGKETIVQIAVGVAAVYVETDIDSDVPLSRQAFWRHSMAVAFIARHIGAKYSGVEPEEAFTAGLLHDIGKLVLMGYLGDEYNEIIENASHGHRPFHREEQYALGVDHDVMGRELCDKWKLSSTLVEAVSIHATDVGDGGRGRLNAIVRAANAAAKATGVGDSGNRYITASQVDPNILRLATRDLDFIRQLPKEVTRIEQAFRFETNGEVEQKQPAHSEEPNDLVYVQVGDDILAHVFLILLTALGFEPVRLPLDQTPSPSESDRGGRGVAGWLVDRPPQSTPDDEMRVVNVGAWLAEGEQEDAFDVVALRHRIQRELS